LLASKHGGTKAFVNEKGTEFAEDMKKNPSRNSCINDKAANPHGYRKMDVGLAKRRFEDNTLAYAVELL
jgi:hypothetical protein